MPTVTPPRQSGLEDVLWVRFCRAPSSWGPHDMSSAASVAIGCGVCGEGPTLSRQRRWMSDDLVPCCQPPQPSATLSSWQSAEGGTAAASSQGGGRCA